MEITNVAEQEVLAGQNVLFSETPISGTKCILHREGSGLITLKGMTKNQCKARYLVEFNGNISVPTGGTLGEISVAIAISGEPIGASLAATTPAAVSEYFNVSSTAFIDVPKGCCFTISVENTSGNAINVRNANLIATRVA